MIDKRGAPLAIHVAGANASDHTQILTLVALNVPQVDDQPGRPRQSPDTMDADRDLTANALQPDAAPGD